MNESNERFSRLADISRSIGQRRTVEEAEFALRLEEDFNADPSILRDIDFGAILSRLRADLGEDACHAAVLTPDELQASPTLSVTHARAHARTRHP